MHTAERLTGTIRGHRKADRLPVRRPRAGQRGHRQRGHRRAGRARRRRPGPRAGRRAARAATLTPPCALASSPSCPAGSPCPPRSASRGPPSIRARPRILPVPRSRPGGRGQPPVRPRWPRTRPERIMARQSSPGSAGPARLRRPPDGPGLRPAAAGRHRGPAERHADYPRAVRERGRPSCTRRWPSAWARGRPSSRSPPPCRSRALLNLSYGTGDSLGLFQQQWDMGWGTPQQIMNPAYAAGKFLDALRGYQATDPAWASQPLYQTAQGVQRSASRSRTRSGSGRPRS